MKKSLVWVLVLTMMLNLFVGCKKTVETPATDKEPTATAAAAEKPAEVKAEEKYVVGVMIASYAAQFQAYIKDAMELKAKDYPNVDFVFVDGEFDSSIQMRQAENFVAQGVNGIIFIPSDSEAAMPAVDLIDKAGIPMVVCNTKMSDMSTVKTYVGSDCVDSGEILMQAMADLMGGKGKMVELQGIYGQEPQIERHNGIMNILPKYPDIQVLAEDSGEWSTDMAMQKMENWLQSDLADEIQVVVCHNDSMAIGAMKAIEAAGKLDQILIAGIDATPEALGYMKEGKLDFTVFQDAAGQGAGSIDAMMKILNGEDPGAEIMIPYIYVSPAEADVYLAKYGM